MVGRNGASMKKRYLPLVLLFPFSSVFADININYIKCPAPDTIRCDSQSCSTTTPGFPNVNYTPAWLDFSIRFISAFGRCIDNECKLPFIDKPTCYYGVGNNVYGGYVTFSTNDTIRKVDPNIWHPDVSNLRCTQADPTKCSWPSS